MVQGDIRLGLMITKGQLEIDVICAKGLSVSMVNQPPGEYGCISYDGQPISK